MKIRLDQAVVKAGLAPTRSQAESWVRLGKVLVCGKVVSKPGFFVGEHDELALTASERYVSRAGLKLASVADMFNLSFVGKVVLDVGSSTGGFTDYALQHGAKKVIAVDVGTDQLHPSLRGDDRIELHEKTDIRGFRPPAVPDIVVIDVSFVSLRDILPYIATLCGPTTTVLAMVKPQFEATKAQVGTSGVIKNDRVRRDILKSFEQWVKNYYTVIDKADSSVRGSKGNHERFFVLQVVKHK